MRADRLLGGDALAPHADILAVPMRADRNREAGLGPVAARLLDHLACDDADRPGRLTGCEPHI